MADGGRDPARRLRAVFMRGGTSKGLVLHAHDLPPPGEARDAVLLSAMGSPDPYGRQLDGMGGGLSSLSKVCIVAPSDGREADVDYLFGQVQVGTAQIDYTGNCGNMSAAIGPFAVDEGLVGASGPEALVRIRNMNTGKIIHSRFPLFGGGAAIDGSLAIPGVGGSGAPVRLEFLSPGGTVTGALLPTGNAADWIDVDGVGRIEVSLVDAANPCVFVPAETVGMTGREMPDALERADDLLLRLRAIREAASVAMGIAPDAAAARARPATPFVVAVAPSQDAGPVAAGDIDVTMRALSSGQPHRALPLTVSLCGAVAAQITGSVVERVRRARPGPGPLRIGTPAGVLTAEADVQQEEGRWVAARGSFLRTARRLFDGHVYY